MTGTTPISGNLQIVISSDTSMLPRKTASLFWQLPSPAVENRNRFLVGVFNRGFLKWGNPQLSFILTGFSSINHPANISELGVPEFMDPHGDFPSLFVRVRLHLPIILQVPSRNFPSRNITINLPSHFCQVKNVHILVIFVTEKGPYFCHHQIQHFSRGVYPSPAAPQDSAGRRVIWRAARGFPAGRNTPSPAGRGRVPAAEPSRVRQRYVYIFGKGKTW